MIQDIRNLGLSKRIGVYHVLFGAIAVGTTAVGMTLNHFSQANARQQKQCLPVLERSVTQLRIALIRNDGDSVQSFVERLQRENDLLFASVVDQNGNFFAHSNPNLVGTAPVDSLGKYRVSANVTEIAFEDGDGRVLREWRMPLKTNEFTGEVRIGAAGRTFMGYLFDSDGALLSFLIPMLAVATGAIVLRRLTGSLSEVEDQLIQVAKAPLGKPHIDSIALESATSLGWNRVVDELAQHNDGLSEKLQSAFGSRESEHWESIVDALPLGVAVTDSSGVLLKTNRNFQAFSNGHASEDLPLDDQCSGRTIQDCLQTEATITKGKASEHADVTSVFDVLGQPPARSFSVELQREDRELRVERSRQLQSSSTAGQFVWTIRDVTQQRMSDRLHAQFVDAATHELRTPLANIKAYAETLAFEDDVAVEEQKEFCNIISSEATRLARFIDDLLDVRSMEVGSMMIRRQNVELSRLLSDAVEKVKPLMDSNGLNFLFKPPPKLPEVSIDKDKIFGVLVNLLGNAAKYTPSGGEVEMRVAVENNELEVAVRDTGVGIAPDEVDQVFAKFFRSQDDRVRHKVGTGLGLSIAKEVVDLHDGTLTVESQIDHGSTFTMRIPTS